MSLTEWRQKAIDALSKTLPSNEVEFAGEIVDHQLILRLDEIIDGVDEPAIAKAYSEEYWEDQRSDDTSR